MWEDLTGAPCLGNTFTNLEEKYNAVGEPDYMTSSQPCLNYSLSGNKKGEDGETGWMFVQQTKIIMTMQPKEFRLGMSDNAISVDGGSEVNKVIAHLDTKYHASSREVKSSAGERSPKIVNCFSLVRLVDAEGCSQMKDHKTWKTRKV